MNTASAFQCPTCSAIVIEITGEDAVCNGTDSCGLLFDEDRIARPANMSAYVIDGELVVIIKIDRWTWNYRIAGRDYDGATTKTNTFDQAAWTIRDTPRAEQCHKIDSIQATTMKAAAVKIAA